jgi:GDP-L-fucose synthase
LIQRDAKIFIAGHQGMVGSAIFRELKLRGYENIIVKSKAELDLTNQDQVKIFFDRERPKVVFMAAAKVGGIYANNSYPADFIYQNLMIEINIIHQSFISAVDRLLFLGSSCIYPKLSSQPINEDNLLTGPLEPTNEPYAIAKIAGIKLCESYNRQYKKDFRSVMPTNLYGFGDNYESENSHVIPSLIRRFHEAKVTGSPSVIVWGTGAPKREFLFVDDLANACIFIMNLDAEVFARNRNPMQSHINIGYGEDISISDLSLAIKLTVGYEGKIIFDNSKPDGSPRKLIDSGIIKRLGWSPSTNLMDGLESTYKDFLDHYNELRMD